MRPKILKKPVGNIWSERIDSKSVSINTNQDNLLDFQRYQLAFTQHLRQPKTAPKPANINAKGMSVYTEIVFNNMLDSVSACFPVAQKVLGSRAWKKLVREFFTHHQAQTPIFREIPQEFLSYLTTRLKTNSVDATKLPAFLNQLAHYEWIELALSMSNLDVDTSIIELDGDLLNGKPQLNAASKLLQYDYPVHRISQKFKPENQESTYLLVFRDIANKVQFIELNAVTFRLLQLIKDESLTGKQALTALAGEINHPDLQAITEFGTDILRELKLQGAIIGTLK